MRRTWLRESYENISGRSAPRAPPPLRYGRIDRDVQHQHDDAEPDLDAARQTTEGKVVSKIEELPTPEEAGLSAVAGAGPGEYLFSWGLAHERIPSMSFFRRVQAGDRDSDNDPCR